MGQIIRKRIFSGFVLIATVVILLYLIFIIVSILGNVSSWEIDYKANIADILNTFVTVLIAVWVSYFLYKIQSKERYEKEILISDVKDMENRVLYIQNRYDKEDSISVSDVTNDISALRSLIDRIYNTLHLYNFNIDINSIYEKHLNMFSIMTDIDAENIDTTKVDKLEIQRVCNDFIMESRKCMKQVIDL